MPFPINFLSAGDLTVTPFGEAFFNVTFKSSSLGQWIVFTFQVKMLGRNSMHVMMENA